MPTAITASMLYNLAICEHRPWMDFHADPAARDAVSPFVEMLWREGRAHEDEVMDGGGTDALDLREVPRYRCAGATLAAMRAGTPLIYGGRLEVDDLCGEPDLLRLVECGRYAPGDIKSGSAEEGPSDARKPKKTYAVQLALYVDALDRLGYGSGRRAFVWDASGREVSYDLDAAKGPRTPSSFWDDYLGYLAVARAVVAGDARTQPAAAAACKLCPWQSACGRTMAERGDLTLIADLGRTARDPLLAHVRSVQELAAATPARFIGDKDKSIVPGVSADSIRKFHARAVLLATRGEPYLTRPVSFPSHATELFFDIETVPGGGRCYLHGFVERRDRHDAGETYASFFAAHDTPEAEREAFAAAWAYVRARRPCTIYIYSKTERTWWRALRQRYPDVCTAAEVEDVFAAENCVDLLDVARTCTEWPTGDRTLKTLARHLGFSWRDADPSGAASIEWYDRHLAGDGAMKRRILNYNEDDCRATRVLLDGIRRLRLAA